MAKQYDATLKELIDNDPDDWVKLVARAIGLPETVRAEPLDADLSTVSPQADKLFRLSGPIDALLHLELQSSWDGELPDRALLYSVLAERRFQLPIYTVVVLLHPQAQASSLTGSLVRCHPDGTTYLTFQYLVLRVWEMSAEELFTGGFGTLSIALLTDEAADNLAAALSRFNSRVESEIVEPSRRERARMAAYILMGLRYDDALLDHLFHEATKMKESSTYQKILREGKQEGMRLSILMMGEQRFGAAMPSQQAILESIVDFERLNRINKRVLSATNWDDLLATS